MKKKEVGIWVRVSRDSQVETESHIHHELRAKEFVKTRGWRVKKIYSLEALSGKSVMDYPETKRMINDIKTGVISGIVFSKIARLARNTKELIEIAEIFNTHGADLVAIDMTIDTSTPMGRHFYRSMGSLAELERELIVDRVNDSISIRAKLGKHLGGQPPLGYTFVDKKLAINKEEVAVINSIYELFIEHKRKRTVARLMNEKGFRTRLGKNFSYSGILRILTDPVYKGLRRMNYSRMTKEGVREIKPKEDWVFHKVDAIVSEEIWNKVATIMQEQSRPRKQPLNRKVHLFTRFVFCHCGAKMYTHNKTKNYLCRNHCGNLIHKEDLEEVFRNELHAYTVSESNMESYFNELQSMVAMKEKECHALHKEKEKIQVKIEKLLDLHTQGQIQTEAFKEYHAKPYERLLQLQESIKKLESEIQGFTNDEQSTQYVINETKNLYENWNTLDRDKKRNVIETITNKIVVGKQDITINLYKIIPDGVTPPFLETVPNGLHNQSFVNYVLQQPSVL